MGNWIITIEGSGQNRGEIIDYKNATELVEDFIAIVRKSGHVFERATITEEWKG